MCGPNGVHSREVPLYVLVEAKDAIGFGNPNFVIHTYILYMTYVLTQPPSMQVPPSFFQLFENLRGPWNEAILVYKFMALSIAGEGAPDYAALYSLAPGSPQHNI